MGRLDRKVALVTGAASGIGAHCALRFAQEGARVAGVDLKKPVDPAAWAAVEAAAPAARFFDGVDVRDEARVASAVRTALERFHRIDVLVNAAGVEGVGPAHELTQESWDRTVDINLKGSFLVAKHVLPSMLARKSGSVINVASVEGLEGMAGSMSYNASKGGVVLMTKSMALDYGPAGIRVNCLCPGLILTPLTEIVQQAKPVLDQMVSWHALGRAGRPEEVAAADASFVTGHALVVDGGWTAGRRILPG
jgi:NAD(P)-dependent dehydrogenase (short-subunit alcohol dehydrogenase family)